MRARTLPALLAAVLALGACSSDPTVEPIEDIAGPVAPNDPALAQFYDQELEWRDCRSGEECTTLTVPLDYAAPSGRTIEISVIRAAAKKQDDRLGSLVVNPGGPGGSGIDYAAQGRLAWGNPLLDHYDIVGFDPRGVQDSEPLICLTDDRLDAQLASDPTPDTPQERAAMQAFSREFWDGCMANDAELAAHMSTEEVARDMDILREALGDTRLTYFGASYGTFIGATYAELFPTRVGRFLLDGAIDPSLSAVDLSLEQAAGFEVALRAYVGACVARNDCFLGRTVDEGVERIQQFIEDLDQAPLDGGDGRELTQGLAIYGIITPLYAQEYWRLLDISLQSAFGGSGEALMLLADAYASRGPEGYTDNSMQVLPVVNCLDHSETVPEEELPAYEERFLEASPTLGSFFSAGLNSCGDWSVDSGKVGRAITAEGAAPIVVLGTTRDPATPFAWAKAMASQLASGVLVVRDGDGHTAYNSDNDCIDDIVEAYLVSGEVPEDGTTC